MKKNILTITSAVCCGIIIFGILVLHTNKKNEIFIDGTIAAMTEEELILDSDLIVEGTVSEILPSRWSNEGYVRGEDIRNILQTDIVLNIENILSGECGETVRVRIDKGEDKNTIVHSDGYPDFFKNEKVLLFLSRDDSDVATDEDYYVLTGMKQGKYELSSNNKGKITDDAVIYENTYKDSEKSELNTDSLKEQIEFEKNTHPNYQAEKERRRMEVKENNKKYFTDLY